MPQIPAKDVAAGGIEPSPDRVPDRGHVGLVVDAGGLRHRPPRRARAVEREVAESPCQQAWRKAVMKEKLIDKNSDISGGTLVLARTRDPLRTLMVHFGEGRQPRPGKD